MELKKDPAKFIKLALLLKNDLNIESAVKRQVTKQTNNLFNFQKKDIPSEKTDYFNTLFKKWVQQL